VNTEDLQHKDLELLRKFEPVFRFTRGERFFPMDVERYIRECSLWVLRPDEPAELLVPSGELRIEELTAPRQDEFGAIYYLKFIEPPDLLAYARNSLKEAIQQIKDRESLDVFQPGKGRLARVGFGSRLVDALFSISLLMRGRVPGDTASAAALTYREMRNEDERYCYYGRVVRENSWVILQYWFFYPFNNWRSGFFGANDHEADWEMVTIYCSQSQADDSQALQSVVPRWLAYASHDRWGDDLRRHWDDPEVEKIVDSHGNSHPVVYIGAGSHASYYRRGEYLTELEFPFLAPLVKLVDTVQDFWSKTLRQSRGPAGAKRFNAFRIPFIDYARGDGLAIGPEQEKTWEANLLTATCSWTDYQGLWGWYAHDPIAGENAPAGPVYNRDGSVRRRWYDPLGWAGLDKVPTPEELPGYIRARRQQIELQRREITTQIEDKSAELVRLGVELEALRLNTHLEDEYNTLNRSRQQLSDEINSLRKALTIENAKLDALGRYQQRVLDDEVRSLRAHLRNAHQPAPEINLRLASLAEAFAAVSIGLLMVGVVLLVLFARRYLLVGITAMLGIILFLEAGFRRRLAGIIVSITVSLAILAALILVFEFFWQIIVALVLGMGIYIMWGNLRELLR